MQYVVEAVEVALECARESTEPCAVLEGAVKDVRHVLKVSGGSV